MTQSHPDPAVTRLLALEDIRLLKHRYIRCMTEGDFDTMAGLLTEDVQAAYSDGLYTFDNRTELLAFLRDSHGRNHTEVLGYWHVTMPEITFQDADHASGIWAMYHFYLHKGELRQEEMFAYYQDDYVRLDGAWKIRRTGYRRVMEQKLDRATLPGLQLTVG